MARTCDSHPFEVASGTCDVCARDFCPTCLVYAHGEHENPFCIPCALTAAGVRRNSSRSRLRVKRSPLPNPAPAKGHAAGRITLSVALVAATGLVGVNVLHVLT